MKLSLDLVGIADQWWTNSWLLSLDLVTSKSTNDDDRPQSVVSGFSISNLKLGCTLFIIWSVVSSLVAGR